MKHPNNINDIIINIKIIIIIILINYSSSYLLVVKFINFEKVNEYNANRSE